MWGIIGALVLCCGICVAVGLIKKKKLKKLWKKEMKSKSETESVKETYPTNETQTALQERHQFLP
jgi:hypothetical protein